MMHHIRKHHISFKNAFSGLFWALKTQPNFRIHSIISIAVVLIGIYVQLDSMEWVLLVFTIVWGLSAEMINTALEAMTDLITQEWKQEAKIAKDVAAAMMLITAFGAVFIGLLLIGPKLVIKFFI